MSEQTAEGQAIDEQEALRRLTQRQDSADRYYAAWWLGHERSRHPETLPLLRATLQELFDAGATPSDDCRALSLNILRALVHLDGGQAATEILNCLRHPDEQIREEAARTAAAAGLDQAIPILLNDIQHSDLSSDRLLEAQVEAIGALAAPHDDVIKVLTSIKGDERPLICSATCRALLQITDNPEWAERFPSLLNHPSPQVRRGVLLDLGAVGWIPALPMIQTTAVENSIKLIALRGLAEHPRGHQSIDLTEEKAVTDVLAAMDALL